MKKSYMLDLIESELYIIQNIKGNSQEFIRSIAKSILDRVEEAGMLPPEVEPIPQHIIDNCESANYWEPEDETD